MPPLIFSAIELIKSPAAKLIGIVAMAVAIFFAGYTTNNAFCRADKAEIEAKNSQAVATQAVAIAAHAKKSQSINTEVSNYVQKRTSDFASRFDGRLRHPGSTGSMPSLSGGPTGVNAGGTGCVSIEQYNDITWEAANSAVMVEGWQIWYTQQRAAFEQLLGEINANGE